MYVCLCRGIKTSDITEELAKRPDTSCNSETGVSAEFAEEIHRRCSNGEGYNCGSCSDEVKNVIDKHYKAPQKTPANEQAQPLVHSGMVL